MDTYGKLRRACRREMKLRRRRRRRCTSHTTWLSERKLAQALRRGKRAWMEPGGKVIIVGMPRGNRKWRRR